MRAAVLHGPGQLVVEDIPEPDAGRDGIVIEVTAAGICGSDLASYATGAYVRTGQVMGHEFAGTVIEVGRDVTGLEPGQRVAARPLGECGGCRACHRGLAHLCERAVKDAIGYGHPGAFAERVRVPHAEVGSNVFPIEDEVSDAAAAMIEVYAVALHACRRLQVSAENSCVVLGLGPVGLAAVQVLHDLGLRQILGIDNSPLRRGIARRVGAAAAVDFGSVADVAPGVVGRGPRGTIAGATAVLEASGSPTLLRTAPSLLQPGGRLGLVALYKEPIALDFTLCVTREIDVIGCYGYGQGFRDAVVLVQTRRVEPDAFVTGTYALDDIVDAFAAQADSGRHAKVQVTPNGGNATQPGTPLPIRAAKNE
jgi:threonine dehydrogenase-like Zn-dependent dehydrogenase